jgi:hypothetical protein
MRRLAPLLVFSLAACPSPSPSSDDEQGSSSTDASSTDASSTDVSTETASTDVSTETSSSDSSSETGEPGPSCPLAPGPGVEALVLDPQLFDFGDDPSNAPSCAITNPERGLHRFVGLRSLDADTLAAVKASGSTLVYGRVLLSEYRDAALDTVVLDEIAAGFTLAREQGVKVIPRFYYADAIDEPDASLERILAHIDQLAPLWIEHADVILTLHAGFIGAWGEWHSSQNGLDAPGPRNQILGALIVALPEWRTVAVRRPSFKQDAVGGPLTAETAHIGTGLGRIAHVNDCFLASDDDAGTYQLPGEKDYAIADSAFVPVGGETCALNPPRSECASALAELALHHWTYLNADYHPDVLASWQQDGCYATIACRLGYRLAALALRWQGEAQAGGTLAIELELHNDGFAAPVNNRPIAFVLDGPTRVELYAGFDARKLPAGETTTICRALPLPDDLPPGDYRIGLRMADPAPTLIDDDRWALRLAEGEWSEGTNWFDATVVVE